MRDFFSHKDLFRYIIASMAGYPSTANAIRCGDVVEVQEIFG